MRYGKKEQAHGAPGRRRVFLVVLVTSVGLWTGGCGLTGQQRTAIEKFSTATIDMAELAARDMVRVRLDVIALRKQMAVIDPDSIDPNDEANDLDGSLTQEQLLDRLHGVTALKEFGELLHKLATVNQTAQIQATADSFLMNLREFGDVELSQERSNAISAAVVAGSRVFTEAAKAEQIREVVRQTRGPIQALSRELRRDFDPTQELWASALTGTIADEINDTIKDTVEDINDDPDVSAARKTAVTQAYQALRTDADQRLSEFEAVRVKFLDTLDLFDIAHKDLHNVLEITDGNAAIDRFFAKAHEFVGLYRAIRE